MKNAKRLATVGLVFLIGVSIFFLNGCLYNRQDIDMAYDEGFEHGYICGSDDGYHEGYLEGKSDGYDEGFEHGYICGSDDGHYEGYREGWDEGYEQGCSRTLEELEPKYYGRLMFLLSEIYSLVDGDYDFGYHVAGTENQLGDTMFLYNKIKEAYERAWLWDYDIEINDPAEFVRGYATYGKYLRDELYPKF